MTQAYLRPRIALPDGRKRTYQVAAPPAVFAYFGPTPASASLACASALSKVLHSTTLERVADERRTTLSDAARAILCVHDAKLAQVWDAAAPRRPPSPGYVRRSHVARRRAQPRPASVSTCKDTRKHLRRALSVIRRLVNAPGDKREHQRARWFLDEMENSQP